MPDGCLLKGRRSSQNQWEIIAAPSGGITIESFLFGLGALGLGFAHALEPDHLAAVSTFVAKMPTPRQAATFGFKWAIGHSLSLLIFGSVLYGCKMAINQPALFSPGVLDKVVGVVLVLLGCWMAVQLRTGPVPPRTWQGWRRALRYGGGRERTLEAQIMEQQAAAHAAGNSDEIELPLFGAPGGRATRAAVPGKTTAVTVPKGNGSLWMGMLHGAAGTGAFVGQAAVTLSQHYLAGLLYTLLFSSGVLLAMSFYAGVLGGVLTWGEGRSARLLRGARWVTSLASCAIGLCLIKGVELPGLLDHFVR